MKLLKSLLIRAPYGRFSFDRYGLIITLIAFLAIIPTVYGVSVRTVFRSKAVAPPKPTNLTIMNQACRTDGKVNVTFGWDGQSGYLYQVWVWFGNVGGGWQGGSSTSNTYYTWYGLPSHVYFTWAVDAINISTGEKTASSQVQFWSKDCSSPPQPSCGDSSCNGGETCSNCPTDCGSCPVSNGSVYFIVKEVGSSGNVIGNIAGATAKLTNTAGTTVYQTQTSASDGWVRFTNVSPGTYGILAYKSGYVGKAKQAGACQATTYTTTNATISHAGYTAAWDNNVPVTANNITYCHDLGLVSTLESAESCDTSFPVNSWRVCYYELNPYTLQPGEYLGSQSGISSINYGYDDWDGGAIYNGRGDFIYGVWRGSFEFAEGDWEFKVDTDDGVKVKVDLDPSTGHENWVTLINQWNRRADSFEETQYLLAGRHRVQIEWFEYDGWAKLTLSWGKVTAPPPPPPPPDITCGGRYTPYWTSTTYYTPYLDITGNFGDPSCDYSKNDLYNLLWSLDSEHADYWFFTILPCESGYNPNMYNPAAIDPAGAWGLFQMGRGRNGVYDHGDVPWRNQTSNAVNYHHINLNGGFGYWQCR